MKQPWLVIGALILVLYGVVAMATTVRDLLAEHHARNFVEAVRTGDQATYKRMLGYPSREDTATARGVREFKRALDAATFYEVKGTKGVQGGKMAVLVEIQIGDSSSGMIGVVMVNGLDGLPRGSRIDTQSSVLVPETWWDPGE